MADDEEEKWNPNNVGEKEEYEDDDNAEEVATKMSQIEMLPISIPVMKQTSKKIDERFESDETVVNAEEEEVHHSKFEEYNVSSNSNADGGDDTNRNTSNKIKYQQYV